MFFKQNILILFALCITAFLGCKSQHSVSANANDHKLLQVKSAEKKMNPDNTLMLVFNKENKVGQPAATINYMVYDMETYAVLKDRVFIGQHIDWENNTTLKLTPYIGMVKKPSLQVDDSDTTQNKTKYEYVKIIDENEK